MRTLDDPGQLPDAALQPASSSAPQAKRCKQRLYVSSYKLNYVAIYCVKGKNQAPIGKITGGIDGPEGLAIDAKGNLYVTNTVGNDVAEYARGSTKPAFTYTTDLHAPAGVAVHATQYAKAAHHK